MAGSSANTKQLTAVCDSCRSVADPPDSPWTRDQTRILPSGSPAARRSLFGVKARAVASKSRHWICSPELQFHTTSAGLPLCNREDAAATDPFEARAMARTRGVPARSAANASGNRSSRTTSFLATSQSRSASPHTASCRGVSLAPNATGPEGTGLWRGCRTLAREVECGGH